MKIVTPDGRIFTQSAAGWQESYNIGGATRIAVDKEGFGWIVTQDGTIYQQTNAGWVQVHNILARDIAIDQHGRVWVAEKNDGNIFLFENGWEDHGSIGIAADTLAVDELDQVWAAGSDGVIFRFQALPPQTPPPPSAWHQMYNITAKDIAIVPDGTVWLVSPIGRVIRQGVEWEDVHLGLPGKAVSISVDADGNAWVAMEDGAIFWWIE